MKTQLLSVVVLLSSLVLEAQPRRMAMPPYVVDFTGAQPVVQPLPAVGLTAYQVANAIYDNAGQLQLFIRNQGNFLHLFDGGGVDYAQLTSATNYSGQAALFAVPGSCNRYGIVYTSATGSLTGVELRYVSTDPTQYNVGPIQVLESNSDNSFALALSRMRGDGTRYLFAISNGRVSRYRVTHNGINPEAVLALGPYLTEAPIQATLSSDGKRIAWSNGFSGHPVVADVDNDGNISNATQLNINAEGLEFSPSGNRLFMTAPRFPTAGVVSFFDLTDGSFHPLTPDTVAYAGSFLQLAADGNIYVAGANDLAVIYDPDGAAPNLASGVVTGVTPGIAGNIRTLPNAVDGEPEIASTCPCGNPSLVQSKFGQKGNFEVVAPYPGGGLAHYWRNNDDPNAPWYGPAVFGAGAGQVDAVSLILSDYNNLEIVARIGDKLAHFWRDSTSPTQDWHGPNFFASGASGTPSLYQGRFGFPGNFEVVTPLAAGGMAHYYRQNPQGWWSGPATFGGNAQFEDVSLIQGNYGDNLEVVARSGNQLQHYYRSGSTWHGPTTAFGIGISGAPTLIQGRFGIPGNFEVVAPAASGGMMHFFRDNTNGQPWYGTATFGGTAVTSSSLIQSNYGDNFEVVARDGCSLKHWWRDFNFQWNAGVTLPQ